MSQASFQRRQREKARQEKAAAKRARREERKTEAGSETTDVAEPVDEQALLAELAEIHRKFADEEITFEEFEEAKEALMQRLV